LFTDLEGIAQLMLVTRILGQLFTVFCYFVSEPTLISL
jgi:hypothetical protein